MCAVGGWGETRAALTLARTLPPCLLTTRHNDLFRALLAGLESKSVVNSKSERQAWVSSIEECVRCASARAPDAALSAHRAWLELVLGPRLDNRIRTHIIEISATAMVSLLVYWMRQSMEHQGEEFDRLVRNFWHNLGSTFLGGIDELTINYTEIENRVDAHVLFLRTLKTSFSNKSKKRSKVRFENDQDDYQPEENELKTPPLEDSLRERYHRDLRVLIDAVCSQYFKFSEAKEVSTSVFTRLVPFLKEFDSTELFVAIARCCGEDESEHWTPYRWYEKKLIRWLAGDTMRCQPLAELVIMVLPHLTATEWVYALSTLETLSPAVVEWCVRFAACPPHCERPPIRDWLRGATPARTLAAACRRFIQHGDDAARDLLLLCLARHHDTALVNEDAVSGVLKELTHALENAEADAPQLGRVAALAARLAPTQAAESTPSASLGALICAMFDVNMRFPPNVDSMASDVWEEVRSAWRAALGTAPPHQRQIIFDSILRNVRKYTLFE
ncbi:hypothetical protein EVAR_89305_1 [Eumeta japonica]|uniref:Uncharacterized protein n=1 Tax=Eumeta variegata TaxID=151549 RepID=A0A4C2A2R1_EUMVA|nr:hypothetical protein EVAR_89305_1 [Eumeta japonica]